MDTSQLASRQFPLHVADNDTGASVVYIMSRDQRVNDNHALMLAQNKALELKLPLVVVFNLLPHTGFRAREHYQFMIDGLREVAKTLKDLNIRLVIVTGEATTTIPAVCNQLSPAHIYADFNPMPHARTLQKILARTLGCSYTVVDTHNIIPAWVVSDKQEFAAHTMRRKIHKCLQTYMLEPEQVVKHSYSYEAAIEEISFDQADEIVAGIEASGIVHSFDSGESAAHKRLQDFIRDDLADYARGRNDISVDRQSNLSPYLHFGQISSLRVALEVLYATEDTPLLFTEPRMASAGETPSTLDGLNALFEEMIVRKELSDNFCLHTDDPFLLSSAPRWAQDSLDLHRLDPREHVYAVEQFESANTHDSIWNAAQRQMTKTSKMHGYMRMYWAKKILEWTESPEDAINIAIYLNDKYSLDGGDPNGYVGILWSIAGLHDRPWRERPIFGKVRYMNAAGLKRKFDIDSYVKQWQ
jgi:deoxyribodipyrimidine photo-lyase